MPIQKLLDYLGYTPGPIKPIPGQVERLNPDAARDLLNPKGRPTSPPPPRRPRRPTPRRRTSPTSP